MPPQYSFIGLYSVQEPSACAKLLEHLHPAPSRRSLPLARVRRESRVQTVYVRVLGMVSSTSQGDAGLAVRAWHHQKTAFTLRAVLTLCSLSMLRSCELTAPSMMLFVDGNGPEAASFGSRNVERATEDTSPSGLGLALLSFLCA